MMRALAALLLCGVPLIGQAPGTRPFNQSTQGFPPNIPQTGSAYYPNGVIFADGQGFLETVQGTSTDCVLQSGSTAVCGTIQTGTLASRPATCSAGTLYQATDQAANAQLYLCTSTNTWTGLGNAATAVALASTPSQCGSGQAAQGIAANGNAQGCQNVGAGGVSSFNSRTGAVVPATGDYTCGQIGSSPFTFCTPDYNFAAQTPGGSLTASTPATVTLTPCPAGVNGADVNHPLYISGGSGTAEAVTITGGTCTSLASSGTVTFTPANNHSGAWTIKSATAGIRECFEAAAAASASCYTPAGTWNIYATLYDDGYVAWAGAGYATIVQIQFSGADGIIIGNPSYSSGANYISVSRIFAVYGFGVGSYASSNALWHFENVVNGDCSYLGSFLGYIGFRFQGSSVVNYSHLWSNSGGVAYDWNSNGSTLGNAGTFTGLTGQVQSGGYGFEISAVIEGLSISDFLLEAASGETGTTGVTLIGGSGEYINELQMSNGNVDSFSQALLLSYSASTTEFTGNTMEISNVRFTSVSSTPTCLLNAPFFGVKLSNSTCYNTSTGDAMTLSGLHDSSFTGNHFMVSNSSGRPLVIQEGNGSELCSNLTFVGNHLGYDGSATPTNAVATDTGAHTNIRFAGNLINGGLSGFSATTDTFFDSSNQGLPIPTISSASTVALTPPVPVYFISGTTAIETISTTMPLGTVFRLIWTNASPGGVTTGGNIVRAQTAVENQGIFFTYASASSPNYY